MATLDVSVAHFFKTNKSFGMKIQSLEDFDFISYMEPKGFWWLKRIEDKNSIVIRKTTFMADSMVSTGYIHNWRGRYRLQRYLQ